MTSIAAALAGGVILGFAGSFHCACMCGGIASGSLFLVNPKSPRDRVAKTLQIQGGRVAAYAVAGGFFAGMAGLTLDPWATAWTYKTLQWLSGAALMWIGLTMAGLLPRLALPVELSSLTTISNRIVAPLRGHAGTSPVAIGFTWGLTPCPMVYAALLPAALTGSISGGMAWMAGFGLGTVPSVTATALGLSAISNVRWWRGAEIAAGLALAVFGLFSATSAWPKLAAVCGLG